jgi:hypothetical protein
LADKLLTARYVIDGAVLSVILSGGQDLPAAAHRRTASMWQNVGSNEIVQHWKRRKNGSLKEAE